MDLENRIPVRNGKGMSAPRDEGPRGRTGVAFSGDPGAAPRRPRTYRQDEGRSGGGLTWMGEVNVPLYARRIRQMLDELKAEYGYSELDAMLALKDILYQVWKRVKAAGAR